MVQMLTETKSLPSQPLDAVVTDELAHFEEQIHKYRAGLLDETKMQKARLQFGTYAQRQEGVQMQRIKIPGGILSSDQLIILADAADRYGSSFIHFTTREDAQLYYVNLDEAPSLLRYLAEGGITTREACGNTVRNITACYRAGTSHNEIFDVLPHADALFRYLVRNKLNQNLGRKFKITFEGCAEDHSALRLHDIGFWAVEREEGGALRKGFRIYLGGGLGGAPHVGHLYTEFLPVEEIYGFTAALLRIFDRYGERKSRMKARMKFLIQTMGWEPFLAALEAERQLVGFVPPPDLHDFSEPEPEFDLHTKRLKPLDPRTEDPEFQSWARDSVIAHKREGFRGVHVRLKLGDITADRARQLAEVARQYSAGQLRISIDQNLFLPWVREDDLIALHHALKDESLAEPGTGTVTDVTTCPGADTCRLGIASAKGLGSTISDAFDGQLAPYRELARPLRIKISGCPNACAHHSIAHIGFHAAALTQDGRTVPAHLLFIGGQMNPENAQIGKLIGKYPAKNCINVVEALLKLYAEEKQDSESFNAFVARVGDARLKNLLEPLKAVPDFAEEPDFYKDYGHENERFAVRQGVKGECAGTTIAETVPEMAHAREHLSQARAWLHHREYEYAIREAYEAAAAAARVPLYQRLVDPFTSDEALWEYENLFVLSGQTQGDWKELSAKFQELKEGGNDEFAAHRIIDEAQHFIDYCANESLAVAS